LAVEEVRLCDEVRLVNLGELDVARIGLGTNRLTRTRDNVAFIQAAVSAGVQMIDSAHSYAGGQSEETIGEALFPIPEACIVATKGGIGGAGRGHPEVLRTEIEQSLRRLKVNRIDLYYLHRIDPQTPLEESLAAIKEYRDDGRIVNVGICEVCIDQIESARRVLPIAAVQNHYNLSERKYDAVVDYCASEGIAFLPFFPLRGSGGPVLSEIAHRHGATPQQVTLAWLLRRSPAMLPIPGTLSLQHLKDNLAASRLDLTDREFEALS
jgi:aryl-alcohol dehydrogenase-like predicted oxidoreductase